ncbi:MAG: hypothetical protein EOP36_08610 [Rubrivivax sp.]|nr:MAG: hypothetical protein EOP36_08610 [Rubrivivax sp.]
MPSSLPSPSRRARNQYILGMGLIFCGAYLMDAFGSVLPMAMGASAGLILSAPLVKELGLRLISKKASD